jgi:hypothetical protein
MTSIPASIAADIALSRQNVALSGIKQNADQAEQLAKVIEETIASAPISGSRGTNVNLLV